MTGRILLLLALASSLLLGVAPSGCAHCPTAEQAKIHHMGDDLVDLAEEAVARGIAPDSVDWSKLLGGLVGVLGKLGCLIPEAARDLLGHLDARAGGRSELAADCARCTRLHHAHPPRPALRLYLEKAARLRPAGMQELRLKP